MLRELQDVASAEGVSKSAIIRGALQGTLAKKRPKRKRRVSCLDLVRDLVGTQPGPRDASTNPAYLKRAILRNHQRARKNSH